MDPKLQGPLKKLAEALHEAIARSGDVDQALDSVKDHGFQATLWLEVTVSLSRLDAAALPPGEAPTALLSGDVPVQEARVDDSARLSLRITPDDVEFLKSLNIRID